MSVGMMVVRIRREDARRRKRERKKLEKEKKNKAIGIMKMEAVVINIMMVLS